jgi:hypothetical protein
MEADKTYTEKFSEVKLLIPDNVTSVTTERGSFLVTTASERCELLEDTNIPLSLLYPVLSTPPPQSVRKGLEEFTLRIVCSHMKPRNHKINNILLTNSKRFSIQAAYTQFVLPFKIKTVHQYHCVGIFKKLGEVQA